MYGLTRTVRTECIRHGMGDWLNGLSEAQRLIECKNDGQAARRRHRFWREKRRGRAPGVEDCGLQLLAESSGALLVTDDRDLLETSRIRGLRCGDLFDLSLAMRAVGAVSTQEVELLFAELSGSAPSYHPHGWSVLVKRGHIWPGDLEALADQRRDPATLKIHFSL